MASRNGTLVAAIFFALFALSYASVDPHKVVLLDWSHTSGTQNFLFRGNMPKSSDASGKDVFAYEELKKFLPLAAQAKGQSLSSDFYLIDVSLLAAVTSGEKDDLQLEKDFFAANPSQGKLMYYPIIGEFTSPSFYNGTKLISKSKDFSIWDIDRLSTFIPSLKNLLYTPAPTANQSIAIYFHCECGCDRTGEVSGAYSLQYLNMTYPEVQKFNNDLIGREISIFSNFAIEWYCQYLKVAKGYYPDAPCWTSNSASLIDHIDKFKRDQMPC